MRQSDKLGFGGQRTKGINVGVGVPDDPFAGTIVHTVGVRHCPWERGVEDAAPYGVTGWRGGQRRADEDIGPYGTA